MDAKKEFWVTSPHILDAWPDIIIQNLWFFGENQCEIIYNHEDEVITRSIGHAHIDGSLVCLRNVCYVVLWQSTF